MTTKRSEKRKKIHQIVAFFKRYHMSHWRLITHPQTTMLLWQWETSKQHCVIFYFILKRCTLILECKKRPSYFAMTSTRGDSQFFSTAKCHFLPHLESGRSVTQGDFAQTKAVFSVKSSKYGLKGPYTSNHFNLLCFLSGSSGCYFAPSVALRA